MVAGTRREEIQAARALLARLQEEAKYLRSLEPKLEIVCPVEGTIVTPRLMERIGTYLAEGELICEVEEPTLLRAEISLPEEEIARIEKGQKVELKVRALPFEVFITEVDQVAPKAVAGELQSTVVVYCKPHGSTEHLRPGMTGHARIYRGRSSAATVFAKKGMRVLRTEFWW